MATDGRRIDMHDLQRDEGVEPERATIVSIVRPKLGVLNTRGTLPDAPPSYTARSSLVAAKPSEYQHSRSSTVTKLSDRSHHDTAGVRRIQRMRTEKLSRVR